MAGLLAGFAVRLHALGTESLWYDETVSAYLSKQSIPQIIAHTARDIHPPAYYLLLHAWRALTSPSLVHGLEFLLAYPSLWFGMAALALLVPLAKAALPPKGAPLGADAAWLAVWLAAFNPFLVWYSQEVRMYTVAAALGLVCLVAAIKFATPDIETAVGPRYIVSLPSARRLRYEHGWLGIYTLAAAAGLYTLYYLAFALVAVNAVALWLLSNGRKDGAGPGRLSNWLLAQVGVILLFLPWLPYMIRQIVEPPVPVWRVPWPNMSSLATDLAQALSALVVGQSVPPSHAWYWAVAAAALGLGLVYYAKSPSFPSPHRQVAPHSHASAWLLLYVLLPIAAIFLISATLTPIYHVRYLAIYAPAFSIIAAGSVLFLHRRSRVLAVLAVAVIAAGSIYSLYRFWNHPDYAADDHRSAVQRLASSWRPGDAILVNAGWVYTAVDTYWPQELSGPDGTRPAPLSSWVRLPQVTNAEPLWNGDANTPTGQIEAGPAIVTGSIDGPASLGWGLPEADFFSMSLAEATDALAGLNERGYRLWHYRLYDTVSDPDGDLRNWLSTQMRLVDSQPYAGRDFLRLELYEPSGPRPLPAADSAAMATYAAVASSASALTLLSAARPSDLAAGETLYLSTAWRAEAGISQVATPLATSLRLVDGDGVVWAQHDESPAVPTTAWSPGTVRVETLALAVPASTPPKGYRLELIVYWLDTLQPIAATVRGAGEARPSLDLGPVDIGMPTSMEPQRRPFNLVP